MGAPPEGGGWHDGPEQRARVRADGKKEKTGRGGVAPGVPRGGAHRGASAGSAGEGVRAGGVGPAQEHIRPGYLSFPSYHYWSTARLFRDRDREQHRRIKEAEMNSDKVHFCTDNQSVSLHPPGEKTGTSGHPQPGTGLLGPQPSTVFLSPSLAGQSSAHLCLSLQNK